MADYKWPPADKRFLIGKSFTRLDGPAKSSGRALEGQYLAVHDRGEDARRPDIA